MDNTSFIANIEQAIISHWDRPSLTDYKKDSITYAEVGQRIARLHILFEHSGVKQGDHIAICGRNCLLGQ